MDAAGVIALALPPCAGIRGRGNPRPCAASATLPLRRTSMFRIACRKIPFRIGNRRRGAVGPFLNDLSWTVTKLRRVFHIRFIAREA